MSRDRPTPQRGDTLRAAWGVIPEGEALRKYCLSRPELMLRPATWSAKDWREEFQCRCIHEFWIAQGAYNADAGIPWQAFALQHLKARLADSRRVERRQVLIEYLDPDSVPEGPLATVTHPSDTIGAARSRLAHAVRMLPKEDRLIVDLRFRRRWSEQKIAARLQRSQAWVSRRIKLIRLRISEITRVKQ